MKKIIFTILILCLFTTINKAQENTESVLKVEKNKGVVVNIKDHKDATIYIDGKKYDHEILKIIDVNKIESIQVLKGEEAINTYGVDNVVLIKSIKEIEGVQETEIKNKGGIKITTKDLKTDGKDESQYPVVIIDGKRSNQQALKAISPEDIESINVLKSEEANKKYDTEIGVIIITMKKKKKD